MEVITEKHRQERLIHEMHAGTIDGDTMSATNSSGHTGINKTIRAVCFRFYWPDISGEVRNFINTCQEMSDEKTLPSRKLLHSCIQCLFQSR